MFTKVFEILGKIFNASVSDTYDIPTELNCYKDDINNLKQIINNYYNYNGWFYPEFVKLQLTSLGKMLNHNDLQEFEKKYPTKELSDKKIKIIPAGNIPLVCFHDIFCILMSGKKCIIKFSQKDRLLPFAVVNMLQKIEPQLKDRIIEEKDQRLDFDGIIATGSNNSSRYFEYYFGKYPHIIRKNRNSVAILDGTENQDDYSKLADDIFAYYGLGCRSVSKIYVPKDYDYQTFFKNIVDKGDVIKNPKYSDNYDYNKAVYLMSDNKILDNNFILLKEDERISSPVGVIFAERYDNLESLAEKLNNMTDEIQCIVSKKSIPNLKTVTIGNAQNPSIFDFADGVDTMKFLKTIQ